MEISNGRFQEFQSSGEPKAQSRLTTALRSSACRPHAHPPRVWPKAYGLAGSMLKGTLFFGSLLSH